MSRFAVMDPETGDWVEVTEEGIRLGLSLAPTPPDALDVERLTAALVELEESKLCNACLSDSCEEHDEMPDTVIGCGDGPALAAIYAALAATLKGADRE